MKAALTSIAVLVAIAAFAAVAVEMYTTERANAVAEAPQTVTAADVARMDAATVATKAAQVAGKKRKPIQARFTGHLPTLESSRMAAKTGVSLGGAWSGTVEVLNQWGGSTPGPPAVTASVSASAITCSVSFVNAGNNGIPGWVWTDTEAIFGPPQEHAFNDPPWDPGTPTSEWRGLYFPFTLTVTAGGGPPGGTSDSKVYYIYGGDIFGPGGWSTMPPGAVRIMSRNAVATWAIAVSNITARGSRTEGTHTGRNAMDYTDFAADYSWYGDSASVATVTATGPDSTVLTASANMGWGDDEALDLGNAAAWGLTATWDVNDFVAASTVYAALRNLAFNGNAIATGGLVEWWSATAQGADRAPDQSDAISVHWSRFEADATAAKIRCIGTGSDIEARRDGTYDATDYSWHGGALAPFVGTFKRATGMFDDSTPYDALLVGGPVIEWIEDPPGTWTSSTVLWTGDKAYSYSYRSWLFSHEYQTIADYNAVHIDVDDTWRAANGEDVGGSNATQNDERCGLLCHAISKSSFTGAPHWGPFITVAHTASLNVNDPPGVPRPSQWVGAGGVTCGPGDSDVWTVPTGATSPAVARSLASRYPLRMDRLATNANPADEHNADWPIMHKANLPDAVTQDDPLWIALVPYEDIRDWSGYSYLLVNLTAPVAGTVTLTVDYSEYAISDPCTTCFEHRYGGTGLFDATPTSYVWSKSLTVEAGANTILVDLLLPSQKVMPVGAKSMKHVNTVTWTLPGNSTGDPQVWELTGLTLTEDPGETGRAAPSGHWETRYKRAWDWRSACWFGYGATIDGKPSLEVDYGYLSSFGFTRYQRGLQYIQCAVHCPDSELTDDIHTLKAVSRLATEIGWQEGWTATDGGALDAAGNKDGDGAYFAAGLYWFDLQHCHDVSGAHNGAVCVGTTNLLAGIEQDWYYTVYPRGRLRGVATNEAKTARERNQTAFVRIMERDTGDLTWTLVSAVDTGEHADFVSTPVTEKDKQYQVDGSGLVLLVANREETWTVSGTQSLWDPFMWRKFNGGIVRAAESGGVVYIHEMGAGDEDRFEACAAQPFGEASGYSRPSVVEHDDGSYVVCATLDHNMVFARSRDRGHTWSVVATATIGTGLEAGTIAHTLGQIWLCGWDADAVYIRSSSETTLVSEALNVAADTSLKVCDAVVAQGDDPPRSTIVTCDDRAIVVCVDTGGSMTLHRCRNLGASPAFDALT